MAAPDRIRLTDSLRRRPRKGPPLFRAAEKARFARLRPAVLHSDELPETPGGEQFEGLGVTGAVGVVEEQVAAGAHLAHRRTHAVDPADAGRLKKIEHDQVERLLP